MSRHIGRARRPVRPGLAGTVGGHGDGHPPGAGADRRRGRRRSPGCSAVSPTTSSWPCTPSCGASTAPTSPPGSIWPGCRPRAPRSWSARARTPAWSTPATASRWPCGSRATTIPPPSSPTRARPPGSGGILRDIFTMGARPIAVMDPLRFGPPTDARSRWIAAGVVSGISGYGNSVGVPTVGGRDRLRRVLRRQPPGQCPVPRGAAGRPAGAGPGLGARQPGRPARVDDRPGRHRRGERAGLGRLRRRRRGRGGQAAQRPGRRSVRGEAADRGVPRAARPAPGGRHPGPRRRRADLRDQRDRVAGRGRHGRRRHRRAAAGSRAWSRSRS